VRLKHAIENIRAKTPEQREMFSVCVWKCQWDELDEVVMADWLCVFLLLLAVYRTSHSASATELHRHLHWFAVQQRITPELAVIPFKTLFLLALWLICQTSSITKHFHVLQYHFINCFCPYPAWRKHCQWKTLALALRQSGTYCHLTVARLSSPAHSNAC